MGFHTAGEHQALTSDTVWKNEGNTNVLEVLKSQGWVPMDADRWQEWVIPMYGEAVRATSRLNRDALDSCSDWDETLQPDNNNFDFPVFVMNLPSRGDRKQHTQCLLRSLGFRNVSFPTSTLVASPVSFCTFAMRCPVSTQGMPLSGPRVERGQGDRERIDHVDAHPRPAKHSGFRGEGGAGLCRQRA
eukprot:221857-Rhodomonas_salina.1